MEIEHIYCAGGNRRFDEIAMNAGFRLGARLPGRTVYSQLWFVDNDWNKPDQARYMTMLAQHRPTMATVLDWQREEQLSEVLNWAEEAAPYVERVLIVPKVVGGIRRLPRRIGGAEIVLAYSVPTKYGGTYVPQWEFSGWPVHLLGGSPHTQLSLAHYMNVVSTDGNMSNRMATQFCKYWVCDSNNHWRHPTEHGRDAMYEAFRSSCQNIIAAWNCFTTARR